MGAGRDREAVGILSGDLLTFDLQSRYKNKEPYGLAFVDRSLVCEYSVKYCVFHVCVRVKAGRLGGFLIFGVVEKVRRAWRSLGRFSQVHQFFTSDGSFHPLTAVIRRYW